MNFQRIDEETVRCIVTEEDLIEYGLDIDDFFTNKEKSREFIESIVEQAQKAVGFQVKNGVLAMQLMPLPKNGLSITFSENGENNFKNMFERMKDDVEELVQKKPGKAASKEKTKKKPKLRVYRFKSLADVEQFSCAVAIDKVITSKLYKDEAKNQYYLVIKKGKLAVDTYNKVCERTIEFADFISDNPMQLAYCEEHYKCFIKKKAIDVMRKIAIGN